MSDRKDTARDLNVRDVRNPYVVLALRRAAGGHHKPERAARASGRIGLARQIRRWLGAAE